MSSYRTLVPRVGKFVRRLATRRTAHREVVLLGPEPDGPGRLTGALLNTTVEQADVLLSDDPYAAKLLTGTATATAPTSFPALYHDPRRSGRGRRWRFYLAQNGAGENTEAESDWRELADVMVLEWPYAKLALGSADALDEIFQLVGSLAVARDRGRLRRATIVISGIPEDLAPRHRSQVLVRPRAAESLQDAIRGLLDRGEGECGHPVADPGWRRFLGEQVLASGSLERLFEGVRRALGKAVPLVFLANPPGRSEDPADLLDWIANDRTRPERGPRRAVAAVNLFLAALLATGLVGFARLSTARAPLDSAQLAELVESDVTNALPAFEEAVVEHEERYRRWPRNWLGSVQNLPGPRDSLSASIELLRAGADHQLEQFSLQQSFAQWQQGLGVRLEQALKAQPGDEDSFDGPGPLRLETLRQWLEERSAWQMKTTTPALSRPDWEEADRQFRRAAVLLLAASQRYDAAEWGKTYSDGDVAAQTLNLTSEFFTTSETEMLQGLAAIDSYPEYLTRYRSLLEAGLRFEKVLVAAVPLLPEFPVEPYLERVAGFGLEHLAANRSSVLSALQDIAATGRSKPLAGRIFVTESVADRAETLVQGINQTFTRRSMQIRLRRTGDLYWHVDVAKRNSGPWCHSCPTDDGSSVFSLEGMRVGDSIFLTLDDQSRDHLSPAGAPTDGRCDGRVFILKLQHPSGIWRLNGTELHYEITVGWPKTWPPR